MGENRMKCKVPRFVYIEGLCDSVARLQALRTCTLHLDFKRPKAINSGYN